METNVHFDRNTAIKLSAILGQLETKKTRKMQFRFEDEARI